MLSELNLIQYTTCSVLVICSLSWQMKVFYYSAQDYVCSIESVIPLAVVEAKRRFQRFQNESAVQFAPADIVAHEMH